MKIKFTLLLLLMLFSISNKLYSQTANFDTLICKEWKLISYEEGGQKFPPSPQQKNDRMIFYPDFKVKSVEAGIIQLGNWQYDPASKILTVTDKKTNEAIVLTVLKLTTDECILEAKFPAGGNLKMYMAPAKT